MSRTKIIASVATAVIVVAVVLLMMLVEISLTEQPSRDSEVLVDDEIYFDVVRDEPLPVASPERSAPTPAPAPANNLSKPKASSGENPAELSQPVKPSPNDEQKALDDARRRANEATSSAFQRQAGDNNTSNKGEKPGDSGVPDGKSSTYNGTGSGRVTGGWVMPKYEKVSSRVTGTIIARVTIGRDGKVQNVEFRGGEAPAATDPALRQRVEAEIRSRQFTRADNLAPDQATAIITYIFK